LIVRLVTVAATVALSAVLFGGCGGDGEDHAKVEANLQNYLVSLVPEEARFPIGAGTPRVENNSCFKREENSAWPNLLDVPPPPRLARWSCAVKFGTLSTPVTIAVDDDTKVVAATPGGALGKPTTRYRHNKCNPVTTSAVAGTC
jgi:hypothetical protein